jgi:hypothetical protein
MRQGFVYGRKQFAHNQKTQKPDEVSGRGRKRKCLPTSAEGRRRVAGVVAPSFYAAMKMMLILSLLFGSRMKAAEGARADAAGG